MPTDPSPWTPDNPHEVDIDRARLREIRSRLPEAAKPLENALPRLVSLTVAEDSFTSFTYSLALAYNEVEAFTVAELRHRAEDTVRIHDGMTASLTNWQDAEYASSIRWR